MKQQSRDKINPDYSSITRCGACKEDKIMAEFYWTNNSLYNSDGYFPICKTCLISRYRELIVMYEGDYILALMHLCLNFDFPFYIDLAREIISSKDPDLTLQNYMDGIMNKVGRKGAFSNKKDTVESITKLMERGGLMSAGIDDEISKFKVTKDVIKRWGEKYDKADLYFLENQYKELLDTFSGTTPIEKNLYMHYSLNELAIRKAREAGDQKTVNDITNIQQKIMNDAKLKPTQDNSAQSDEVLVGMFIKGITENAPLITKDSKWVDTDGIGELVQKEMISTMYKSLGVLK